MSKVVRISDDCVEKLELVRQKAKLVFGDFIDSISDSALIALSLSQYHNYLCGFKEEKDS